MNGVEGCTLTSMFPTVLRKTRRCTEEASGQGRNIKGMALESRFRRQDYSYRIPAWIVKQGLLVLSPTRKERQGDRAKGGSKGGWIHTDWWSEKLMFVFVGEVSMWWIYLCYQRNWLECQFQDSANAYFRESFCFSFYLV